VYPTEMWGSLGTTEENRRVKTVNGNVRLFWSELVAALDKGTPPPVLLSDAIRTHRVLDAAILSAETNVVVRLSE
jgi:predicted dehydrogenase